MAFARIIKVTVNRRAIRATNGPADAVARATAVRTAEIARTLVGLKTGNLKASIRVTPSRRPAWNVEAGRTPPAPYALVHHTGRKRMPRKNADDPKPLYVFEIDGRAIFTPGPIRAVPPNPYLTEAARRAGSRKLVIRGTR